LEKELNLKIYNLYHISDSEIEIIENSEM